MPIKSSSESEEDDLKQGRLFIPPYIESESYVEELGRDHIRADFDCGKPDPNNYIRVNAVIRSMDLNSYVFLPNASTKRIAAYYAISPDPRIIRNTLADFDEEDLAKGTGEEPVVIVLKWLATDLAYARRGIGKAMLLDILEQMLEINSVYPLSGLVLTPLDEEAENWYHRQGFGFIKLPVELDLYLSMDTIRALAY